jgi:hypothetical protein
VRCDLTVYLTPVTFGGYSSVLKTMVDRLIPNVLPFFKKIDGEIHHTPRYERYPALVAIGVQSEADAEAERIFKTLVSRNAINYHAPAQAAIVLTRDQASEKVRADVAAVLERMEVGG